MDWMTMDWILFADQWFMIGLSCVLIYFVIRTMRAVRWLQEVLLPLVAHIETVVDPDYPKPPDPPPVDG